MNPLKLSADAVILELVQRLQDPHLIQATMHHLSHENPEPAVPRSAKWNDLSLGGGYSGLVVLFSLLQETGRLEQHQENTVHQYVLKIKESIDTEGILSLSLFSGLTGVCCALHQASMKGTRYQNILRTLHGFLFENIDSSYLTPLRKDILNNQPSSSALHDVISGLSGIGRYALEHLSDSRFNSLTREIITLLIARVQPFVLDGYSAPGWGLSPHDVIYSMSKNIPEKITFNTGLAHGVTGILAFFSIALLKGVEVEGQINAIRLISNWLRNKSYIKDGRICWMNSVSWEEETEGLPSEKTISKRPSWCYGVLGIARSLFLTGKALGDEGLKTFALTAFRQIFSLSPKEWNLTDPTLCHGVAGLLLITHEMAQEKGGEDLLIHIEPLEDLLLSFYNPDFPLGFKSQEMSKAGALLPVTNPGFLEGTTGILLTLLHRIYPKSEWHLPLLIG